MTDTRDAPLTGGCFLVSIGDQDGRAASAGFADVVFPPLEHPRELETSANPDGARLVLRRGVTGRLDLYEWWNAARRDKAPPTRTVTIRLLAADRRTVVMTWRFLRAYPVTLSYSPLGAMSNAVVMEQVALAFERVEMT
jgi:phage tail-like protein